MSASQPVWKRHEDRSFRRLEGAESVAMAPINFVVSSAGKLEGEAASSSRPRVTAFDDFPLPPEVHVGEPIDDQQLEDPFGDIFELGGSLDE